MRTIIQSWILGLTGGILLAAAVVSCVENPATGKREFVPFMPSRDQQVALGVQSSPQFIQQSGGKYPNENVQRYVQQIGAKVAAMVPADQKQGYQFSYTVLNDDVVNAFALPGGPIFISKGLLFRLQDESQLAFVLGHETGHVIAQHVGRQMSTQTELSLVLGAVDAAAGKDPSTAVQLGQKLSQFAGQMYLLKYSRTDESQADTLGLRYLVGAGYDPAAAVGVMKILEAATGDSGKGNDWFQTHPATETRVADLQKQIQTTYPQAYNNPAYKRDPAAFQAAVLRQR
ncbi:MAG: M48 family metalloprotease [Phycisphaerae bacterium]